MKRTIAITLGLLAFTIAAPAAKAELLYFMADSYNSEGDTSYNFAYASIGVALDGNAKWGADGSQVYLKLPSLNAVGEKVYGDSVEAHESGYYTQTDPAFAALSYSGDDMSYDYTDTKVGYTFYLETRDEDWKVILTYDETTAKSFAQLKSAGYTYSDDIDISAPSGTYWVVPEPTSGMLLLLGLAGLALRRRVGADPRAARIAV